jgi:hypothetical protein
MSGVLGVDHLDDADVIEDMTEAESRKYERLKEDCRNYEAYIRDNRDRMKRIRAAVRRRQKRAAS